MDCCIGLKCSAPCRIAARFFSAIKRRKVKTTRGETKEDDDAVAHPNQVAAPPDLSSERCRTEANFNVIIGCVLLQLVAKSKNELQNMTELRIQMESVLQNVKDELRNKDLFLAAKEVESNNGIQEGWSMEKVIFDLPLKLDNVPEEESCLDGMDRLEAELEVELERLQLHFDSGKLSTNHPQDQEPIEESSVDGSTTSDSMSYGEVIDPTIHGEEEDCRALQSGVPPYELERRLHELLEKRQEQQIRELEVALASAKQELHEKEREISWWKDTAQLMSRHVQEPSRFGFLHTANMPTGYGEKP
ncbi:POLAR LOCALIZATION DURING ASYMMETRIC DIVISION AND REDISTRIBUTION [Hibiscus trionum]|uniref:POLAR LOCALIZATION DURING ASYMMETRIC DIVISION AND REDISTRIBUTION n=1 Tax=Hibiscus trionum TaxID=183268 RepID=A0A9W7MP90_HIBTR|nr:POLAR LOCALIZATION DURING ASYMMETRIC DIVISION AND REDISTRIBUTION [Hibiscus trionum]